MPKATRDRDDLHIEIFVSRAPGSLNVQSYSDVHTDTLGKAINEAQQFIYACRRIKRQIDRHGLGVAAPVKHEPLPPGVHSLGQLAAETWETVMKGSR